MFVYRKMQTKYDYILPCVVTRDDGGWAPGDFCPYFI
jgi:hypothetical protein